MSRHIQVFLIALLFVAPINAQPSKRAPATMKAGMKAGFAKIVITPEQNVWMAGYANRAKPAEGKIHDLYAKALAIQDSRGARVVFVTTDLLGLPRALTSEISEYANKSYGLRRDQMLFNSSHTHTGPVVKSSLAGAYDLDATQSALIEDYTRRLKNNLLKVIGEAIKDLSPAKLSFGRSTASFAMNRRQFNPNGVVIGVNPEGVVDREVPALRVESTDGKLRGVVFGYACHNTTLTGEFYEFCGDYAGFAQEAVERAHPGATAMFLAGCGADINPYPRSKRELAEQHGDTLAKSVEQASSGSIKPVSGAVKSVIGGVMIPFDGPPTKEEFQSRLNDKNVFKRRHAERMIARYERDGKLISEYPYTIQILKIGDLTLVALAGEVVTDYAMRLKRELGGDVWVAGYSNDLCSYIPSARMFKEGGYEVIDSMIYYDLPGPYKPELEERIIGKVHELARRVGVKAAKMKLNRIVLAISAIALLSIFILPRIDSKKVLAQELVRRREFYRKLAYFHAPILFQDTETRGQSQDEGSAASVDQPIQRRGDFIARFDFDGDWNGLNNWANFAKRPPADKNKDTMARAFIYYSVVETETHYFINYCAYHAQDREPRCSDVECHENDLEGGLHVVKKGPENGGMGTLWMMMYLAHDNWFTYLTPAGRAAGIKRGGRPPHETPQKAHHYNAEFIYDVVWRGVTPDGKIFAPRDQDNPEDPAAPQGATIRPSVWSEPWGHGMYGWPGPDAKSPYDRYRWSNFTWKDGFVGGDGVIYYPSSTAGVPDFRKEVDVAPYALIDIFEPNGLWDRREQIDWKMDGCGGGKQGAPNCVWGYFGAFRGQRWGVDKANAPWRWDHVDDNLPPGMQAYDPLRLVEEFNNLNAVPSEQLSRKYTNNAYLGLPAGTRPSRAAPTAEISTKDVVVKPNEPFTLDGGRSRTSDLDSRGRLLFRWESQAEGFGEPVIGERWIRRTLTREGVYSIKLTVNDGDHSASDEATVIVRADKLFFDDFHTETPPSAWRFLGQTWIWRDGMLSMQRPGGALNAAVVADRIYPADLTVETLMRLDLLYEEAREPFGVGVGYRNPTDGNSAVVFGFTGTRRTDSAKDPSRRHLTEVAFYDVSEQRRVRLGDAVMTYQASGSSQSGYKLGEWYHVKLTVEGGEKVKAKIWPRGSSEPEWMYEATLPRRKSGIAAPMVTAGVGASGAASYDYLLASGSQ